MYGVLPCDSPPLYGEDDLIAVLSRSGADKVILMTHPSLTEPSRFFGHGVALLEACRQFRPAVLFLPDTLSGRDLAPAVASSLGAVFVSRPLFDREGWKVREVSKDLREHREIDLQETERPVVTLFRGQAKGEFPFIRDEAEVVVLSPGTPDRKVEVVSGCTRDASPLDAPLIPLLVVGSSVKKETAVRLKALGKSRKFNVGVTLEAFRNGAGTVSEVVGVGAETPVAREVVCLGVEGYHRELLGAGVVKSGVVVSDEAESSLFDLAHKAFVGSPQEFAEELLTRHGSEEIQPEDDVDEPGRGGEDGAESSPLDLEKGTLEGPVLVLVSPAFVSREHLDEVKDLEHFALIGAQRLATESGVSPVVMCCGASDLKAPMERLVKRLGWKGVVLWDEMLDGAGYRAYERVIAAAVKKIGASMVLTGDRSSSWGHGILGPALAKRLGWAHVTGGFDLTLHSAEDGPLASVDKLSCRKHSTWTFSLPGVVTFAGDLHEAAGLGKEEDTSGEPAGVEVMGLQEIGVTEADLLPLCRSEGECRRYESSGREDFETLDEAVEAVWEVLESKGGGEG